jgi:hypothetical protein
MAILGKVAGPMLRDNLVRNGVDLSVDTNVAYFDVNNRRVGVNTTLPRSTLDVNGLLRANSAIMGNVVVTANLVVPVGSNNDYPAVAATGQFRFNNDLDSLEYFDGVLWLAMPSAIQGTALISSDRFTGNSVARTFTLSQDSSTEGSFVAVNGVMQIPNIAYTVTGNVLTFTSEIPVDTDVIEVRSFAVNKQVATIRNGGNLVDVGYLPGGLHGFANIYIDGKETVSVRSNVTQIGTRILNNAANVLVQDSATLIDQFGTHQYRSAKYYFTATDYQNHNYHAAEGILIQAMGSSQIQQYNDTYINSTLVTLSTDADQNLTNVYATSTTANTWVNFSCIYVPV